MMTSAEVGCCDVGVVAAMVGGEPAAAMPKRRCCDGDPGALTLYGSGDAVTHRGGVAVRPSDLLRRGDFAARPPEPCTRR